MVRTDITQSFAVRAVHAHAAGDEVRLGPERLIVDPIEQRVAVAEVGEARPPAPSLRSRGLRRRPQRGDVADAVADDGRRCRGLAQAEDNEEVNLVVGEAGDE